MKPCKMICLLAVILILMLMLPCAVGAASERLIDDADLLTADEERQLLAELDDISDRYAYDVIAVTTDTMYGMSTAQYAEYIYDRHQFGYGNSDDGVLLLISNQGRYLLTSGECYYILDDAWFDDCIDTIVPWLDNDEYAAAISLYAEECAAGFEDAAWGFGGTDDEISFSWVSAGAISLVIGFVAALIVVSVMRAQLKSVKMQTAASDYERAGSFTLTAQNEMFLFSQVTRRAKPKNTSSSGGGSRGRARGGRSF